MGGQTVAKIGAMLNKDPEARKQELEGFDFMDKSSIEPIINLVQKIESSEETYSNQVAPSKVTLK